jgi:hypothetical protein
VYNDEHCSLQDTFLCITYMRKLSCDHCFRNMNNDCMNMSFVLVKHKKCHIKERLKWIGIYIYHAHTFVVLLVCLQNKHRRGWLYFQERQDDVGMNISDTRPNILYMNI